MQIADRMREGNVSAARQILTMAEKDRAAPPQPTVQAPEPETDSAEKLGKKEQLNLAAKTPTAGWGRILN